MSYLDDLAERIVGSPTGRARVQVGILLRESGHTRASIAAAATDIEREFARRNLSTDFARLTSSPEDDLLLVEWVGPSSGNRSPSPATPTSMADVAESVIQGTLEVLGDGEHVLGTAFCIHPSGIVLTARHVIDEDGVSAREVNLKGPTGLTASALVFESHPRLDYAMLWVNTPLTNHILRVGTARTLRHAETVIAVGHPLGMRFTVSQGIVSNPASVMHGIRYIQTDTAIDPGNSGGPLVNASGEVVGINVFSRGNAGSGKFALAIDHVVPRILAAVTDGASNLAMHCYCRLCGFRSASAKWYCSNCGAQHHLDRRLNAVTL